MSLLHSFINLLVNLSAVSPLPVTPLEIILHLGANPRGGGNAYSCHIMGKRPKRGELSVLAAFLKMNYKEAGLGRGSSFPLLLAHLVEGAPLPLGQTHPGRTHL